MNKMDKFKRKAFIVITVLFILSLIVGITNHYAYSELRGVVN